MSTSSDPQPVTIVDLEDLQKEMAAVVCDMTGVIPNRTVRAAEAGMGCAWPPRRLDTDPRGALKEQITGPGFEVGSRSAGELDWFDQRVEMLQSFQDKWQKMLRLWGEILGKKAEEVLIIEAADPQVRHAIQRVAERVPEIMQTRRAELNDRNIDALLDLYLGSEDPVAGVRHALEMDNARERARFLEEVPCLTSRQVAGGAGHRASNTAVTASRWKQQGKVFSVPVKGAELYPAFQFRDGRPHSTVARVLAALPDSMSPWQTAFWFTSSNGWLRGATPADRLDDADAVVAAAGREAEPALG